MLEATLFVRTTSGRVPEVGGTPLGRQIYEMEFMSFVLVDVGQERAAG